MSKPIIRNVLPQEDIDYINTWRTDGASYPIINTPSDVSLVPQTVGSIYPLEYSTYTIANVDGSPHYAGLNNNSTYSSYADNTVNGMLGNDTGLVQGFDSFGNPLQVKASYRVEDTLKDRMRITGEQLKNSWDTMNLGQRGALILNTVGGLLNAYNAYKANKLGKQQLDFQRDSFNKNFENQRKMTNSRLEDRQRLRNIENPTHTLNVNDYMKKFGV